MKQKLGEAATIKARAKGLLRAIRDLVGEKAVPKDLHAQLDSVETALKKTWADLEADAGVDAAEAARGDADGQGLDEAEWSYSQIDALLRQAIKDKEPAAQGKYVYVWVRDVYPTWSVYDISNDGGTNGTFKVSYVIGDDGKVTLGDPQKVTATTVYLPVAEAERAAAEGLLDAAGLLTEVAKPTKTEGGKAFPVGDFAYVPDAAKPSTWKLRLTAVPGGDPDAAIVGAAVAALGPGFRGKKVQIPDEDLDAVKAKVRTAWKKANPDKKNEDLPAVLAEADLDEAANMGDWLESRLHAMFTQITDDLFGFGQVNRDERIALSGAIGDALDAFHSKVESAANQLSSRPLDGEPPDEGDPDESMDEPDDALATEGDRGQAGAGEIDLEEGGLQADGSVAITLMEKAVRKDGTIPIRIITPGWGTSGYYKPEVLKRDGPKAFPKGTKMFLDHPTTTEEAERPERSVRDLAAELKTDARWDANHAGGPGLYAEAFVLPSYRPLVEELAPHIGLSIRASGQASSGEAEGRKGPIIEKISAGKSIDFVTEAGRGGRVMELLEGVRAANVSARRDVRAQTPAGQRPAGTSPRAGAFQEGQVDEKEAKALQEANVQLTGKVTGLEEANKTLAAQVARLSEVNLLRAAKEFAGATLAAIEMPAPTRVRLAEALAANPPTKTDGALDEATFKAQIEAAATAELEYLGRVAGLGQVRGMGSQGGGAAPNAEEAQKRLGEAFARLGLSESQVKIAAAGR